MTYDSASHSPQITLRHGTADATFAARLARDLLNMYGEETVRLVGPTDPGDGLDISNLAATPTTASISVVVISPEALASGEVQAALRSTEPIIVVTVREGNPPTEQTGHRVISFAEPWRYDLALAELLDTIRLVSDGPLLDVREGVD